MTTEKAGEEMSARSRSRLNPFRHEPLEPRLALSGPADVADLGGEATTLVVAAVDPPDGTATLSLPREIAVTFDRPIDPFSIGLNDLRLERLDADGLVEWSTEAEGLFLESLLDDEGTRLSIMLPDDLATGPGTYRVVLSEFSFLSGMDGSMMGEFGVAQVLSTFTLTPHGATLDDALDLDTLDPGHVLELEDVLDFNVDPRAVRLYRFIVPEGHAIWRLGAAVVAQADGSMLDAALALFDASGRVLGATDKGLNDSPEDPFLYAGLAPGTYYLGVSGVGNLPGRPGGYDPALGLPELVAVERASGLFRLMLVADPADTPTFLHNFSLRRDDPFDPTPTGFTLQFTGVVYPTPRTDDGEPLGIRLFDAYGRSWALAGAEFDVNSATLGYAIVDRLPVGQYRVVLSRRYPLVDLTGRAPVALGQPDRVLATFNVTDGRPEHGESDLGAAYLRDLRGGLTREVDLQPGESYTYRLVATRADLLRLKLRSEGGTARVDILTSTGNVLSIDLEARPRARESTRLLNAMRGEVILRFTATGDAPVSLRWTLATAQADHERLLLNGNGQGPALGLRLVAPASVNSPVPGSGQGSGSGQASGSGSGSGSGTSYGTVSNRPAFDPVPELPSTPGPAPIPTVPVPVIVTPIVLPTGPTLPSGGTTVTTTSGAAGSGDNNTSSRGDSRAALIAPASGLLLALPTGPVGRPPTLGDSSRVARAAAGTAEEALLAARAPTDGLFGTTGQDIDGTSSAVVEAPPEDLAEGAPPGAVAGDVEVAAVEGSSEAKEGEDWVAAWIGSWAADVAAAEVAPAPEEEALANDPPLIEASLDPFRLRGWHRGGRSDSSPLVSDLTSPVGMTITVAAVVEGRRRLRQWLDRRRVIRLAHGVSAPLSARA